jgi:hypothetical protein
MLWLFLMRGTSYTTSAWSHATTCQRGGREALVGGHLPLGVGRSLTKPLTTAFAWRAMG